MFKAPVLPGVCYDVAMTQHTEGFIDFNGYKTWYSTYGDLASSTTPLVVLHGGPGFPHQHLRNLSKLAGQGIPVVLYDQLGCGNSDKPDKPELWTTQLFIDELNAVRNALQLDKVSILGHSWGGSLAAEYVLTNPQGVDKLILSSPLLDTKLWIEETDKLKDQLPKEVAETMRKHEATGTTDSEEYKEADKIFNLHFVCRLDPKPKDIQECEDGFSQQVYETMWGPSESHATGVLKDWSVLDRLHKIKQPVLLLSGKYDEATPKQMELAHKSIPGSKWVLFENSSHATNHEEEEKYLRTVADFLGSTPSS